MTIKICQYCHHNEECEDQTDSCEICGDFKRSIVVALISPTLSPNELEDWLDSTFEMLDMGDITYEVK